MTQNTDENVQISEMCTLVCRFIAKCYNVMCTSSISIIFCFVSCDDDDGGGDDDMHVYDIFTISYSYVRRQNFSRRNWITKNASVCDLICFFSFFLLSFCNVNDIRTSHFICIDSMRCGKWKCSAWRQILGGGGAAAYWPSILWVCFF